MTWLQGQYLAFIQMYTKVNRRPPAEADIQRYFRVTPPTVHDILKRLEEEGVLSRQPGVGISMKVLLPEGDVPRLG